MHIVVFAGPSIYGIEKSKYANVDFRPPAATGDVLRASDEGARCIGLIDGVYGNTSSVWHKEILSSLERGISVYGAASMGALRAAECAAFGMIGLGSIFLDYVTGRRVSDADVAVLHAPAELKFQPLSVSLVEAQDTLARIATHLEAPVVEQLMLAASNLHFSDRTWKTICINAGLASIAADLAKHLQRSHVYSKRDDAVLLLEEICLFPQDQNPVSPTKWRLQRTAFYELLEKRTRGD